MAPRGARVLQNDWGTAPGFVIEQGDHTAILLPGPPIELEPMWRDRVEPYLFERSDSVIVSKNLYILGMGESAVEEKLRYMMEEYANPTVAPYAGNGECRVRVSARAKDAKAASEMCDDLIEEIKKTEVGEFIYGIDVDSMEKALVMKLMESGKTIACAESCTGGLIAKRITDISGCSDVFLGGCVTYSNDVKVKLLGVNEKTLEDFGAVSANTAKEMARGVRLATGSDIGISSTGIAGPTGGSDEKPVGVVFISISTPNNTSVKRCFFDGNRDKVRRLTAVNAIGLALEEIRSIK
jgi:nicotinamide-nucleotide amidase